MTRRDDAITDRYVAAAEHGDPGNAIDHEVMFREHLHAVEAGLLDPDEPTPYSDMVHRQVLAEVAAMELWVADAYAEALAAGRAS